MKIVINTCYGGFHLSDEGLKYYEDLKIKANDYNDFNRHNPALVKTIEDLGEKSYDNFISRPEIVEIEDGLEYEIDDYDGLEMVIPYIPVTIDELKNGLSEDKIKLLSHTKQLRIK